MTASAETDPATRRITALFIGDSVTDAGRRFDPSGGLGAGYVRRLHEMTPDHVDVVNRGIDGNRVRDLRERWDRDVLALSPDVVTILVGINDTWRRYDSGDPTSTEDYASAYDDLVGRTLDAGVRVALMEPFLVPVDDEQRRWRSEDLDPKIAAVREIAQRRQAPLVKLDGPMNALAAEMGLAQVVQDGIHPAAAGYQLIAERWLQVARRANLVA